MPAQFTFPTLQVIKRRGTPLNFYVSNRYCGVQRGNNITVAMVVSTTFSGYVFSNVGPLTTTFTAPASCATSFETGLAWPEVPKAVYPVDCEYTPTGECYPGGAAYTSIQAGARGGDPRGGYTIAYNSPGTVCPFGWETVGTAEKPNPTSNVATGPFNISDILHVAPDWQFVQPPMDVFRSALGPSDTAVACCPRSAFLLFVRSLATLIVCYDYYRS